MCLWEYPGPCEQGWIVPLEGIYTQKQIDRDNPPHLVEQRTVCYGNTQWGEAPAEHHVIGSVVAVAATAAGDEPGHGHSAEHHPTRTNTEKRVWNVRSPQLWRHKHTPVFSASPSSSRRVAVSVVNQAVAISLPQTHRLLRLIATQQPPQPGEAGRKTHFFGLTGGIKFRL